MAWPNSQARRVKMTTQNGVVAGSGTHTGFIVFLTRANIPDEMCSPSDGNRAQSNGQDIRAAIDDEASTQLPIDVIQWEYDTSDGAGDASILIAVKRNIATGSDTDFWLAYDTDGATSQDAADATFGSENVYTECELAALTDATSMTDRSGNHTLSIDNAPVYAAGSPLENFAAFVGNDRLSNADASLRDIMSTHDTTVSFWVRDDAYDAANAACWAWEGTDDVIFVPFDSSEGGQDDVQRLFWRDLGGTILVADLTPAMTVDVWHLLHLTTRASNDHELLVDGASKDTSADTGTAGPFTTFRIGGFETGTLDYNGDIANILVFKTARSNDWCNTEFANQNSPATFVIEGTPEDIAATVPGTARALALRHQVLNA